MWRSPGLNVSYTSLRESNLRRVREAIRSGGYISHTSGLGKGYLQTNIAILPQAFALDFMRYCQRNPKPCPLAGVSDTGNPIMFTLGRDLDIRTDVPAYSVYRDGVLAETLTDISGLWNEDLVAFALGCSFTFEHALQHAGISLWHIDHNKTVPMFRTNIDTVPAGPFSGNMVVSMRMVAPDRLDDVIAISKAFPMAHGAPIHWGDPHTIGISDSSSPDWGDCVPVPGDQVPVFWACGVTPQVAIQQARPPLCITHKPGHMLITDIPEDAEVTVMRS